MTRGTVIGPVWATRQVEALQGKKLVLVACADSERLLVCLDALDVGPGDQVLVSFGSGARNVIEPGPNNRHLVCDAAISQIIDGTTGLEG
jgi:microcompartment protein CcmK/EutM